MEKESPLQILYLESVGSTQTYLKTLLREEKVQLPFAVVADVQTNGLGSRGNSWTGLEGNLFLSFAISLEELPKDLALESSSIYFAYLLKETLQEMGSEVWLKWPNDFYINNIKTGGMITNISRETLICGVGLNLESAPEQFAKLDIKISKEELLKRYFKKLEKKVLWKQVFSKYKLEFYRSQKFFTHNKSLRISLDEATLNNDGSITSNGERIFSLR